MLIGWTHSSLVGFGPKQIYLGHLMTIELMLGKYTMSFAHWCAPWKNDTHFYYTCDELYMNDLVWGRPCLLGGHIAQL